MKNLNFFASVAYGCTAISIFAFGDSPWVYVAALAWVSAYVGHIADAIRAHNGRGETFALLSVAITAAAVGLAILLGVNDVVF